MSTIKVDTITDGAGTGAPTFSQGATVTGTLAATTLTGTLASSSLTGALPAIDGSALTGLSAGALVFISSSDLSSDATADFTGFNSALYDSYEFVFANVIPATDNVYLYARTSSDGGSTYDSGDDYQYSAVLNSNSFTSAVADQSGTEVTNQMKFLAVGVNVGSNANEDGISGVINVLGPHLAKRTKLVHSLTYDGANGWLVYLTGGASRKSSADVDAIRFFFNSGNIESGTITMYGRVNS